MKSVELPHFRAALQALGPTDRQRAAVLDMPLRTFTDLKTRKLPRHVQRIARPDLLRALADDMEHLQHTQLVGTREGNQLESTSP